MIPFLDDETRVLLRKDHPPPRIADEGLAAAAHTRSTRHRIAPSAASWYDKSRFELLESLGDCITTAAIGRAIFAHLTSSREDVPQPGVFKSYRDLLTSNYVFSQLVLVYGFHTNVQPPIDVTWADCATVTASTVKRLGDIFEAYVGALDADGRREDVDRWLHAIAVHLCSLAERAAARFDLSSVPVRSTGSEPFVTFVRFSRGRTPQNNTRNPERITADCSCWKKGLSLYVRTHGLRYDMQTNIVHRARLTFADGRIWEGDAATKLQAEQEVARTSLLDLDADWAAQMPHVDTCPHHESESAQRAPAKRQRIEE